MNRISIITVCFDAKELIQATINSVLSQHYFDFEYIIIDGGSNQYSLDIIEDYLPNNRILFSSEPDQGVYDAMNKGLALAQGEYVLFLNAGDELVNQNTLHNVFSKSSDADLYYGETNIINMDRKIIGTRSELTSRKLPDILKKNDFLNGQVVSHQSFIPKRSLCKPFNLKYKCSADIDWMLHIIDQCKSIQKTSYPISNYLQGGISDTQLANCWKERFFILVNHFNPMLVIWQHLIFAVRYIKFGAYKR